MKRLRQTLTLAGITVWIIVGIMAVIYLPSAATPLRGDVSQAFTRAEFITIILTAVTVILAALAIMLAIAAFWGYTQIQEGARRAAETTATRVATETAQVIAARVAEKTAQQTADGLPDDGDAIGKVAGSGDAGSN